MLMLYDSQRTDYDEKASADDICYDDDVLDLSNPKHQEKLRKMAR